MALRLQVVGGFSILVFFLAAACVRAEEAAGEGLILNTECYWRCHLTLRDPVAGTPDAPEVLPPDERTGLKFCSALPPADWAKPGFDDGNWWHTKGPVYGGPGFRAPRSLALLCMRGAFTVDDPAAVKEDLNLSVAYRGGAVVYLNGEEVARAHLPEGEIDLETFAENYPLEVYTKPDGKALSKYDGKKHPDLLGKRLRKLSVELPAKLLRKGTNTLALELHRAPTCKDSTELRDYRGRPAPWTHVGCDAVGLRSASASVKPNLARPKELQVWNSSAMQIAYEADYGAPGRTVTAVRLVGARGGSFSGQAIAGSDAELKLLGAEAGALKKVKGKGAIPVEAVRVRYALPDGPSASFDALAEKPRTGGLVHPVWVTVDVPREATAGEYEGQLSLRIEGEENIAVPVRLSVSDWTLPEPKDHVTFVDLIQSPETVALKYGVELWSDEHFALLEKSLALMGRVGSKVVYIPLMTKTHFGNAQSMVRWVKDGNGGHTHDFTAFDRYMDLVEKCMGKPMVVALYVWERYTGPHGGLKNKGKPPTEWYSALVTEVDPKTGEIKDLDSPKFTTAEFDAFWKPVIDALRERMKKRGLEKALMIGVQNDFAKLEKTAVECWAKVAPGIPWVSQGHGLATRAYSVPVGYSTTVWNARFASDPTKALTHGWQQKKHTIVAEFPRDLWKNDLGSQMVRSRLIGEVNIQGKQRGYGRLGADFWPVLKSADGKRVSRIIGRYGQWNTAGQLTVKTTYLAPGESGAISTARFEMMCEGVQECEARIFIEKALLDEAKRAKLGDDLAKRCRAMLDERIRAALWSAGKRPDAGYAWFVCSGWQERSRKLYDLAGEVARALAAE